MQSLNVKYIALTNSALLIFLSILLLSCSSDSDKHWAKIENDFKLMPQTVRPNPLWFWNNAEVTPDELRAQMADFKKAGYGGLSILPFGRDFKPKYLTDAYFEMYGVCMEEAQKLGLSLWIYDEYGFPSGTAGDVNGDGVGRFKQRYPQHTNKRLDRTVYTTNGEALFELQLPSDLLMAVVAMDTISFERIDLKSHIAEGKLKWNTPKGHWQIQVFTCVDAGNTVMDYMSTEAAELYIGMTHEEYYKHFSTYFGSVVKGTFFDEPTLYYADGRSWTPAFNEKFEEKYAHSPALYYPALWQEIGEDTEEARNALFGHRSDLFAQGYIKHVNDWSKKHGLLATGHQDNEEVLNCVGTSGDLMKVFKYLDVPGIDKIGGNRAAERYYKLISSSAYNWDHSLVMSETYGAMGNISWEEIYGIAMDQYVKGINVLIPHAVWYNTANVTFLPELSLRNPIYAQGLPAFNDYLSRLNSMMQNDARWLGDIAVLYPINTMQGGHYLDGPLGYYNGGVEVPDLDYVDVGVHLFDSLGYDFMFLHPEVLEEQCLVSKNKLQLNNKLQYSSFSTLIVPGCRVISLSNLEKIDSFAKAGGTVIFTTKLPEKGVRQSEDASVVAMMKKLVSSDKVYFVENPDVNNLRATLAKHTENYALNFTGNGSVSNIHKVLGGKNTWFFANPQLQEKLVQIELSGKYELEAWNPHTGETRKEVQYSHQDGKTAFELSLSVNESLFIVEK